MGPSYLTALTRQEMMGLVEDENIRLRFLDKTEEKLKTIQKSVKAGRLKNKDKIAHRLYRWIDKWNMERFFKVEYEEGSFSFFRKEPEIERYSVLDGCYVIVSNVDGRQMTLQDIHSRYKDLKYVENAFRSMKVSDSFLGPVRHWNETRVRGHVFMCMLAYLVVWEARKRLEPLLQRDPEINEYEGKSLREVWDTLKHITVGRIKIAGIVSEQISALTKKQRKIVKMLGTPMAKRRVKCCR